MSRTRGHRGCLKSCGACAIGTRGWLRYRDEKSWNVDDYDRDDAIEPEEMWWLWGAEYWAEDWASQAPPAWVPLAPVRWTLREKASR